MGLYKYMMCDKPALFFQLVGFLRLIPYEVGIPVRMCRRPITLYFRVAPVTGYRRAESLLKD